ncbi:MAG: hypothetical protein IV107_16450 [Paucibacter sp.]|nr:hypothetical protein [Roseateles sp.]
MKMTKASEKDIDAAGNAMSVLNDISSGYCPARDGEDDAPTFFDPDDKAHLRKFYDLMNATLDAAPGWPGRVIGGMCYVILFDKNEIVDPAADTLEIHPRFAAIEAQRDEMLAALQSIKAVEHVLPFGNLCDCIQCQFVRARSAGIKARATPTAPQEGS